MNHPTFPDSDDPEVTRLREQVAALEEALAAATCRANDLARSNGRLAILAEASRRFAAVAPDSSTLAREIAQVGAENIGDLCIVQLFPNDGVRGSHAVMALRDPAGQILAASIDQQLAPPDIQALLEVMRVDQPLLLPEITAGALSAPIQAACGPIIAQQGVHSLMMALLEDAGEPIGVVILGLITTQAAYTPDNLALLQEISERASLVLSHVRKVASEQEARALLDTFFATAPVGLAFLDAELRYVRINDSLAEMNGLSPAEHIGRTIEELLPGIGSQLMPLYRQVLTTGEAICDLEVRGITPAAPDSPRVWLVSYYPVPGADGQVIGIGAVVLDITERTRAEEALQRQAETLREQAATLDLAHIIVRDAESRIVAWNQGAAALYGWPSSEALGQISHQLFQTRFPVSREAYENLIFAEGTWEGELVHRRKDGGEIVVASHQILYRDVEGRPQRIIEVNNDITALKRIEQALRESEALLTLAHEVAELGTTQHDLATGRVKLGARAQAQYGFTTDTITLDDLLAHIHPDDLARLQAENDYASDPGSDRRSNAEYRVLHPDGTVHWLAVRSRVYRDDTGAGFAVGASQDITIRKQAEEDLRRMTERLRMLNTIDRAILAAQTTEQIASVVVNRLQQLVPCDRIVVSAYDSVQQRIQRLAISDVRPDRISPAQTLAIEPRDWLPPFPIGECWYVSDIDRVESIPPRAVPYKSLGYRSLLHFPLIAEGRLLGILRLGKEATDAFGEDDIAIVGDVADQLAIALHGANLRAQVEQERALLARRVAERTADLSAANAELARTARVKDEFLSNMSHELRTPLNAILGRAELLREQIYGPLTTQQEGAVQSIAEAGQHLLTLINDILDLSKVEAGKLALDLAPLEVETIGRAAVRMVAQLAATKKIALTTLYDSRVEKVVADERRLKQILVNLLSNAVKFTPEGGKVGLEVQADPAQQVVTFTVWDTGIGIALEDQGRLFQPFVQIDSSLNRQHEGTGLGLALVLRLTELHGGSVSLVSNPGKGSLFSVALPWTEQIEPAASAPEPRMEAAPGAPLSIRQALVIEDSHTAVEQLSRYLSELGSQVEVHDRASGAVERARELQPDLIVLDILLPDQTGWEVLSQLKADPHTAAIPVLVASVVDDPARALALGAAGFVLKPLTRDRFIEVVRRLRIPEKTAESPIIPIALVVIPKTIPSRPAVLLVDDNEANLEVLVDYLTTVGYDVIVARNGAEAVAQAEELRPAVILMDIQMPVMDGLEATRRIRAAGLRDTPIVALTALAMTGDRERCLAAGANAYLAKPVSLRTLQSLIDSQIQGGAGNG